MRSFYGPEKLLLASKKPHIIDLVARSETMSIDEIKALKEKPDIIKGLLNLKKAKDQFDALIRANAIADAMIAASKTKI